MRGWIIIVLFIVLFQNQQQTSYTFRKGTYFMTRDVTNIQGCTHLVVYVWTRISPLLLPRRGAHPKDSFMRAHVV